jgi:hypothetical protein
LDRGGVVVLVDESKLKSLISKWRIRALGVEARSSELYWQTGRSQDAARYLGNAESLRSAAAELEELLEKEEC